MNAALLRYPWQERRLYLEASEIQHSTRYHSEALCIGDHLSNFLSTSHGVGILWLGVELCVTDETSYEEYE